MTSGKLFSYWLIFAIGMVIATMTSLLWLDEPIAHAMAPNNGGMVPIGRNLGSAVLISGEMLVMLVLVIIRLTTGRLWSVGKATLIAVVASLTTFAFSNFALKLFFGAPNPLQYLFNGMAHGFHYWQGGTESSFPSGHMVLSSAFAFAFSRIYLRALFPLGAALLLSGTVLVIGDWHFLSDVIAGTFVGSTGGLAAGELWLRHNSRLSS